MSIFSPIRKRPQVVVAAALTLLLHDRVRLLPVAALPQPLAGHRLRATYSWGLCQTPLLPSALPPTLYLAEEDGQIREVRSMPAMFDATELARALAAPLATAAAPLGAPPWAGFR